MFLHIAFMTRSSLTPAIPTAPTVKLLARAYSPNASKMIPVAGHDWEYSATNKLPRARPPLAGRVRPTDSIIP